MALSMDEQRALAEIERRLAADDPGLATCLTAFRRPGQANVLRSPRARIVGSLFTVLLVAIVSLMVYAMIPFRAHGARTCPVQHRDHQRHIILGERERGHRRDPANGQSGGGLGHIGAGRPVTAVRPVKSSRPVTGRG